MNKRATVRVNGRYVDWELDVSKFSQANIYDWWKETGWYEAEVVRVLKETLRPGDTFIDVGAHVGYFALIGAALVGPTGKVLAIEPEMGNCDALRDNIGLNGAQGVVEYFRNAAASSDRQLEFWVNRDNDGGNALWDVGRHPFNVKSKAEPFLGKAVGLKLDTLMVGRGPARMIKVDTEGAEFEVLLGAEELLRASKDCVVVCEINRFGLKEMGSSEEQLRGFMKGLGYRTYYLGEDGERVLADDETARTQQGECDVVFNVAFRR